MQVNYQNQSNTQNQFHTDGKNPYVMTSGLQGDYLEAAKTARKISVALDELATRLLKNGRSREEVFELIRKSAFIGQNVSEALINMNRTYQPLNDSSNSFRYAYLISIPPAVLHLFRPYLVQYFKDPTQGIGPNLWVTRKSIEIYIAVDGSGAQWRDLNRLSIDVVKDIANVVAKTGRPLKEQVSTCAESEQVSNIQDEPPKNESCNLDQEESQTNKSIADVLDELFLQAALQMEVREGSSSLD
tara:strand:- start:228 stop:959 length:732 start_codon:yes stop_codon:yes gene_type:complete